MIQKNQLIFLIITLLTLSFQTTFAQVSGISYTLSPTAEYSIWDDKAGLENNLFVGGKVGFGFGEFFELRGNYMQSINGKTNFSRFELPNYSDSLFVARDVNIARWGGSIKANIGKGALLPFVTVGTGIQSIQLDTFDINRQIYVNAGVGVKLSLADRYTLVLEAKNTSFRYNPINLLTDEDITTFDLNSEDFMTENLSNWSIGASLQFYLGGRKPGKLSELDKAYFDTFSGGFSSAAGTLEPTVGRIEFHESLPYRDTWLAGGSAGIDLGPYVGLRGFYWRGLEDGELTSFDQLAMYGGEVRMRLNTAAGMIPYLTLGGGNIDVQEDYTGRSIMIDDTTSVIAEADNRGFAMGGIGLTLPLSDNFQLFGGLRAVLTSGASTDDIQAPDQVQTSLMYSAGLKFAIGKKSKNPDQIVSGQVDEALAVQKVENEAKTEELKNRYEKKVLDLEEELNTALEKEDYKKAAKLKKEQEKAREVVGEIEARQAETAASQTTGRIGGISVTPAGISGSEIRMTPAEFENIIDEILDGMNGNGGNINPIIREQMLSGGGSNAEQLIKESEINRRVAALEKQIEKVGERQDDLEKTLSEELKKGFSNFTNQLNTTLEKLNNKIDNSMIQMDTRMRQLENNGTSTPTQPQEMNGKSGEPSNQSGNNGQGSIRQQEDNQKVGEIFTPPTPDNIAKRQGLKEKSVFRKMSYAGTSGFAGFNLGGSNTANFGIRGHYPLAVGKDRTLEFVPETFFGLGSTNTFGVSGNLLVPVANKRFNTLRPYIGGGLGLMKIEQNQSDQFRGALNLILGTYLDVWKGRLYVDLAGRNLFRNNQLVAGYRLPF